MINLAALLPQVVPAAVNWAEDQELQALLTGATLTNPWLRKVASSARLLGPGFTGVALGHAISIVQGHLVRRLLTRECRPVHPYEAAGSIAALLPASLQQIATVGCNAAPFEVDAREHVIH